MTIEESLERPIVTSSRLRGNSAPAFVPEVMTMALALDAVATEWSAAAALAGAALAGAALTGAVRGAGAVGAATGTGGGGGETTAAAGAAAGSSFTRRTRWPKRSLRSA